MTKKRVLFLTGTRADYGKIKPLIQKVHDNESLECRIFATGMHTLERYGFTVEEIRKDGFEDIYMYVNQIIGEPMDLILANTIHGLSRYIHDNPPDLLVYHGDRVEALAASIVGSLRNIHSAHIEGGEVSGTADEIMRHAISKLSHSHFVANDEAASRLRQMGEEDRNIHVIGSPDIDVMLSASLPDINQVKAYYEINFERYAISIFHPVTTELAALPDHIKHYVDCLEASKLNYLVIFPNNDEGTEIIQSELKRLNGKPQFRCLPSIKFEAFLTALKHADFIIGNSSAAIREAPVYGIPTVNVGTRQNGRFDGQSIVSTDYDCSSIENAIETCLNIRDLQPDYHFGAGESSTLFAGILQTSHFWNTPKQKTFIDIKMPR